MKLSPYIKDLLAKQCGCGLNTSSDCTVLALDIETRTREHMGANTIKRLLGFIDDERQPRVTTLNIIAQYLGYKDWDTLKLVDDETGNSIFGETENEINISQLEPDAEIEITYQPNRRLVIKFQGDNTFLVTESENSKLHVGDIIDVDHIVREYPLLVSEVVRDGESLGSFTAGKAQGIEFKL